MPSDRVLKQRSRNNRVDRQRLAESILASDSALECVMPCTPCFRRKSRCVSSPKSSRCVECVLRGRACDGSSVGDVLLRTDKALVKIRDEEEKAEEQLAEVLARLQRLRKQKRLLKSRHDELFARGIQQLDEDDAVDRAETGLEDLSLPEVSVLESEAAVNAQSVGAVDVIDWSSFADFLGTSVEPPGS